MQALTAFSSKIPTPESTIALLFHLPALASLDIVLDRGAPEVHEHHSDNAFPALRTLKLETGNTDAARNILRRITSTHLGTLEVTHTQPAPSEAMQGMFRAVTERHVQLQKLSIQMERSKNADLVQEVMPAHTLKPLFELRELSVVDMRALPVAVNNETVLALSAAWPKLKALWLSVDWDATVSLPLISMPTLVYLIHGCKDLEMLGLRLNTELSLFAPGISGLFTACGVHTAALRRLDVGRSKVADPVGVASFFSDVFPELEFIDTRWLSREDSELGDEEGDEIINEEMENHERWMEVEGLIREFYEVRTQERCWAQKLGKKPRPREIPGLPGEVDLQAMVQREWIRAGEDLVRHDKTMRGIWQLMTGD
ncbi:hypothetical protein C8Q76DRAFT_797162 [Earliella scabrosa]|nr:hypothetical protein C8Q76DRAFT_797162 [Earliella scabrosa]